ncbi:hypothetical protein ACHAWO_006349 [Cyclotella atomus]|uniref:MATH domain-containing protein n=1 Tax=Cyclotella atomus TaxID=382360 RepID=A0ABD3NM38_9STRA
MSTAREIHVGTPAPDFPLEESVTVHFHVFANLTTEKDEEVCSPSFTLAGFEWNVCIYPGGNVISDEGMFLRNEDIMIARYDVSDIAFKVGRRVFHAHKCVLKAMEPRMPIENVEPKMFELMLQHVDGKAILPNEWAEYSKPILEASGKYGFTALKEEAEAWHIKRLKLTVDNAVDEGLKKAVMDFIVENGKSVITSPSFANLKESGELVTELMLELAEAASNNRKRKLDEVSA